MDEYEYNDDVYFLDDERNARGGRKDHRPGRSPGQGAMTPYGDRRPRPRPVRSPGGSRPVVIYQQPPEPAPPRSGLLANLTTDEIVELAAQVFAAIQPLPPGPVASGDARIDIENLIVYQGALALHAKRDEQLRTVGSLLAKLISK
jgi:hypothetical protein